MTRPSPTQKGTLVSTPPDPYSSNSQMTGADPSNLPQPAPANPRTGTSTIQRVGYVMAAVFVGVVIYMTFIA